MKSYDDWKLHTPDNDLKVFCTCDWCGSEIYEGEEYLKINGDNIHDDCFSEYAEERLNPKRRVAGE